MFIKKIEYRAKHKSTLLCVGLDPNPKFILDKLGMDSVISFNKAVIDATEDLALCYKPQIAHYSAFGLEKDLINTIAYVHNKNEHLTVILDAKRGDIGSTAEHYAVEAFDRYGADAVTVNPYLGFDGLAPFLKYNGRGVIALARTSNPSADWPQLQIVDGKPFFLALAKKMDEQAHHSENLLFVVGATDQYSLAKMREQFPERWFLVPGIGTQGGNINDAVSTGGKKIIINVTRAILYPKWDGKSDYFEIVRAEALKFHKKINSALAKNGVSLST